MCKGEERSEEKRRVEERRREIGGYGMISRLQPLPDVKCFYSS
jgi:hypothetical protein